MADVFAEITRASPSMLEVVANVLELRAALPQQRAMLEAYLSEIEFPAGARVLEVGCGTGPVARVLATWPKVAEVVGVDPSPALLGKARELGAGLPALSFREADGKALPFEPGRFDIVILHTVLTHVPGPDALLAEAFRVVRPGGWLGACDGDFASATVAIGDGDPLQSCVEAFVGNFVHDRWLLLRRLPTLVQTAGFKASSLRCHSLVETSDPGLTLTWIDRGADAQAARGSLGPNAAAELKAEARRRAVAGTWFGYMTYGSLVARRPE